MSDEQITINTEAPVKSTALVLSGAAMGTDLAPTLFRDFDFNVLKGAIDALGDASKDLTLEEKQAGVAVVAQWQSNVIDRLNTRNHELNHFVSRFETPHKNAEAEGIVRRAENFLNEYGQPDSVAIKTSTEDLLQVVYTARQAWKVVLDDKPEKVTHEDDEAVSQITLEEEQVNYKLALSNWTVKRRRAEKAYALAYREWLVKVNESTYVEDTLRQAKKFSKNLSTYIQHCTDQAEFAKLNIVISSVEARNALRQLLDFSIDL
jgi:hypothetical protein